MVGKRHIADTNQNIAEPQAVTITALSMYDLMFAPHAYAMATIKMLPDPHAWASLIYERRQSNKVAQIFTRARTLSNLPSLKLSLHKQRNNKHFTSARPVHRISTQAFEPGQTPILRQCENSDSSADRWRHDNGSFQGPL